MNIRFEREHLSAVERAARLLRGLDGVVGLDTGTVCSIDMLDEVAERMRVEVAAAYRADVAMAGQAWERRMERRAADWQGVDS